MGVVHPYTSVRDDKIETIKETVIEKRRVGIREIIKDLNISYGSTEHILVNVNARFVPKNLNKYVHIWKFGLRVGKLVLTHESILDEVVLKCVKM